MNITRYLLLLLLSAVGCVYSFAAPKAGNHGRRAASIDVVSKKKNDGWATTAGASRLFAEPPSDVSPTPEYDPLDESKRNLQTFGYIASTGMYASISLILLLMPDKTRMAQLATKLGGVSGFAMAAAISALLSGASYKKRLSSDTYKRLNLGLVGFCALGLPAFPGEAAFTPLKFPQDLLAAFMGLVRLAGGTVAFLGWKKGAGAATVGDVAKELADGTKDTMDGLKFEKNTKSALYRGSIITIIFGMLSAGLEILNNRKSDFGVSLHWSALSRLFLISTMLYSLKDAAERDRLTASTFINMNYMVGAWCVLVGIGQGLQYSAYGFTINYSKMLMMPCGLPFLLKALKSKKDKEAASG